MENTSPQCCTRRKKPSAFRVNAKSLLEEIFAVSESEAEKARLNYGVTSLLRLGIRV